MNNKSIKVTANKIIHVNKWRKKNNLKIKIKKGREKEMIIIRLKKQQKKRWKTLIIDF